MRSRIAAVLAAAAALVLLAALAITATGSDTAHIALADRTVIATMEKSSAGEVDNKPKGPSVGDTWQGAGNISENGARVGRFQLTTTLVDAKYHSGFQTGVLILADGTITYQGSGIGKKIPGIPVDPDANVYAITGGTGVYAGAGGSFTVTSVKGSQTKAQGVLHFSS
jgi:hypothetical protein